MRKIIIICAVTLVGLCPFQAISQIVTKQEVKLFLKDGIRAVPSAEQKRKAVQWIQDLNLKDNQKVEMLSKVVADYLKAIRDWHNSHSYESVPAGINPKTGLPLSELERQIIIDSSIPDSVQGNFMKRLNENLTKKQVEAILDKWTIGKVDFTFSAYKTIVPDLKPKEQAVILGYLKQARAQAIGFKSMKEISAIFEIYKTKCEDYLNTHGRNWRQIYQDYYDKVHAK